MNFDEMKKKDQQNVCNTYGRYPIAITKAKDCRLYGPEGEEYIDMLAGIAVVNLGHSRPELLDVINEQYQKLVHVSNLFYQDEGCTLAEKLTATCGADKVFFANSGAEANEAAIKLARRYMRTVAKRDAYEIITLEGSFHGRTIATVTATGQPKFSEHFDPLPAGFKSVPFGDLDAMREAIGPQTAAVFIEVIQGEGGIRPLSEEYLKGLEQLCLEKEVLFMIDEVQTGMCRTGKFWAHQHYDLAPDIFTTAKPLANGLAMGAMFATDDAARGFEPGTHATTFGAGALVSAVASKVVDIMLEDDLAGRATEVGEYAQGLFRKVAEECPGTIADVRGKGLMLAVELAAPGLDVWKALIAKGFILNLTQDTVLRLVPPLTITKADMDAFAAALKEILSES